MPDTKTAEIHAHSKLRGIAMVREHLPGGDAMTPQEQATQRWLLARMRTIRAGIMLVIAHLDEIGIELSEGTLTSEMAARNVSALEELPIYIAAHTLSPSELEHETVYVG